jgi:hypothetical protein
VSNPWVERIRDLPRFSPEWRQAVDDLAENDHQAYRQWVHDQRLTEWTLRELNDETPDP